MKRSVLTVLLFPFLMAAETLPSAPAPRVMHLSVKPCTQRLVFQYSDRQTLKIDDDGNLLITTGEETVVQETPVVSQRIGDSIRLVSSEYTLGARGQAVLTLGPHDSRHDIEIDSKIPARLPSAPSVRADSPASAE